MKKSNPAFYYPLVICLFLVLYSTGLLAETVNTIGTIAAESTIYEDATGDNGGGYNNVCVGNQATLGTTRNAYIRFDLPSMPAGAILSRVQLNLLQESVRSTPGSDNGKAATLQLHLVTSSWAEGAGGEGDVNPCAGGEDVIGIDWAGAPGNEPSPSATEPLPATINSVPPPPPTFITIDTDSDTNDDQLINDILAWYADPGSNHGWKLSVEEETDNARILNPISLSMTWTDPRMIIEGNGTTINNGDTTPSLTDHTDFGSFDTATGQVVRTFTASGGEDLILTGTPRVVVSGSHASDFTVSTQPDSPVVVSTTFQVTFDPSADDLRTASLSIANNDPNENPYTFSIQGTGTTTLYAIGGTVSGLSGTGLVLQNNAGDDLPVAADGGFTFATALDDGSDYAVTVLTQPGDPVQTCGISNGSGTLAGANVTNIEVNCTTNTFTIGGNVSGVTGTGLVLQNNAGDDLPIAADGGFAFATALDDGSDYSVTVLTQPNSPNQTCSVSNGSGSIASVNIVDVNVTCDTITENIFTDSFED